MHLKIRKVSPCDNSTIISALTENRNLKNMIEAYIASGDCDDETRNDYNAAKIASEDSESAKKKAEDMAKGKKLFEEKKVLEAANLGYPIAMGAMSSNYVSK